MVVRQFPFYVNLITGHTAVNCSVRIKIMTEIFKELTNAEKYSKEMLEAYDSGNFTSNVRVASNRDVHDFSATLDICGKKKSTVTKT